MKIQKLNTTREVTRTRCELSRAELVDALRKGGIPIPDGCPASVDDPSLWCGHEDPATAEPITVTWVEVGA